MSLIRVGERTLRQVKSLWFLWEPAWDSWRPITALAWDGERIVVDDAATCSDPTDPLYGYGSPAMREVCVALPPPSEAPAVPLPAIGATPEWFYDRFVCLTPCAPRDRASWKRLHKGKYWTPKAAPKTRLTRRHRV